MCCALPRSMPQRPGCLCRLRRRFFRFSISPIPWFDSSSSRRWARRGVELNAGDAYLRPRAEATLAQVLAVFGHTDAAVAMVPHLLEVPNGETRASMRLHPVWDPLRNDPAFLKLVATDTDGGKVASSPH